MADIIYAQVLPSTASLRHLFITRWFNYYLITPATWIYPHSTVLFYLIRKFYLVKSLKFSFSGKGYRVYADVNAFSFTFGHSHLFYIYFFRTAFKLHAKTKGFLLGLNSFFLNQLKVRFFESKPLNIFTWRGVRFSRAWYAKKAGKISMYR